jgi:hypothetical protein
MLADALGAGVLEQGEHTATYDGLTGTGAWSEHSKLVWLSRGRFCAPIISPVPSAPLALSAATESRSGPCR